MSDEHELQRTKGQPSTKGLLLPSSDALAIGPSSACGGHEQKAFFLISLHGLVETEFQLQELETVLSLMCDGNSSSGTTGKRPLFHYERVFKAPSLSKDAPISELRCWTEVEEVVSSLEFQPINSGRMSSNVQHLTSQWYLQSLGAPVVPHKHECLVRIVHTSPVDENYSAFLDYLGYKFDYEFVEKGMLYQDRVIEARVHQIFKLRPLGDLSSARRPLSPRWIVELRAVAADASLQATEDYVWKFAKSLEQYVFISNAQKTRSQFSGLLHSESSSFSRATRPKRNNPLNDHFGPEFSSDCAAKKSQRVHVCGIAYIRPLHDRTNPDRRVLERLLGNGHSRCYAKIPESRRS